MNEQMIRGILDAILSRQTVGTREVTGLRYRTARYLDPGKYDQYSEWKPLTVGDGLPRNCTVFIEGEVTFPEEILCGPDYADYLYLKLNAMEGILRVDGETYHGLDGGRDRIPLRTAWAGKTKKIEIEAFSRRNDVLYLAACHFGRVDKTVEKFYYDLWMAWDFYRLDARENQNENMQIRNRVMGAMKESIRYFDTELEGESYRDAVKKADLTLCTLLAAIDDGDVRGTVSFVGHTHIDVAWLWQLKDTVRKCGHSFSNMLRLMDEYPEFTFACSQMQLFDYTKKHYPDLYEQIKKRVAEGRWETVGPMWVESDCNVISGESLVRQFLYGIEFMKREFGTRNDIAWLPDTFGFQPNIPQIMQKTGTRYFYSNKIHWQGQNRFPYTSFIWRGIDGSEVTASIPLTAGFYNGDPTVQQMRYAKDNNQQTGSVDDLILPYGHGDGGGGPTPVMVENARRLKDFPGMPKSRVERASDFFARIEAQKDKLPLWYGDLYIETHRGTLSTRGHNKRNNRLSEILYQNAEKLGVLAAKTGAKPDWNELREGWHLLLLQQFHDILPGSSIREVYEDTDVDYARIFDIARRFTDKALEKLGGGEGLLVLNTLGFARSGIAVFECEAGEGMTAVDAAGKAVPTTVEPLGNGRAKVMFRAEDVPALGGKHYTLRKTAAPKGGMKTESVSGGMKIENDAYIAQIDGEGRIARLYDKKADREALSAPANDIRLFYDGPQHEDAWNIFPEYRERHVDYKWETSLELCENSALRTVVRVIKKSDKAVLRQDITFYPDSPRIDFVTHADWHEKHKVMRVYFPCNINTPHAALEVGFGTFMRPTVASTNFEKSRFEVCAQKWIDLSEGSYGVSVLNDCKYGHDVNGGTLGITLLRSTTGPDPMADRGEHDFTYSLYAHAGDWRDAATPRQGLALNTPFVVKEAAAYAAALVPGFAECGSPDVIIDTVKPAEDGKGVILRLYECNGNHGRAKVTLRDTPKSVEETNLIEEPAGKADLADGALSFAYKPYEIKTFRIIF